MSYQPVRSKGKFYEYYTCNQYANKKTCKPNAINKQKIEEEFYNILDRIISDNDFKKEMKNSLGSTKTQIDEVEHSIKRKEREIKRVEEKQDRLFDEMLEGSEAYREKVREKIETEIARVEDIKSSIEDAKKEIKELETKTLDVNEIITVIENTVSVLKTFDKETKQKLIRKLISKINTENKHIKSIEFSWGEVLELSDEDRTLPQVG